jgi:hypothetical protein
MTQEEEALADLHGPYPRYAEHKRGARIVYHLPREAGEFHGTIIWAVEATREVPMHYLVAREEPGGFGLDICFPAFLLEETP